MMNTILAPLIDKNLVLVYMDDILIHAADKKTLRETTKQVLELLKKHDLYLKPEKYEFERQELRYLGYIVSPNKVRMDPIKLKGISNWETPTTLRKTRQFLGFCNFYRKFIKDYAKVITPINSLVKKNSKFNWTNEAQKAFEELKKRFKKEPILMTTDPTRPFEIFTDASNHGTGAVLTQKDENGVQHPCFFYSKPFTGAEKRYHTAEQEFLAIIRAIQEWRQYIDGAPEETVVWTDHNNIIHWTNPSKLSRRIMHWSTTLSVYKIKIKHVSGNRNTVADALSRKFNRTEEEEPQKAIPDQLIDKNTFQIDRGNLEGSSELSLKDKQRILFKNHNHHTAGHPGIKETTRKVLQHHYWPGIRPFITNYVRGCEDCQKYKINRRPLKPLLQGIPAAKSNRPFSQISMDLITDLPKPHGNDAILSIVDHGLTKGIILIPTTKGADSKEIAKLLIDNLFKRYGIPDKVISDRDPRFVAKSMKAFMKGLGIKQATSTAFHPQTDGTTERFNQEIELYLAIYCANNPGTWVENLSMAEYAHNSRPHAGREQTPFELILGHPTRQIPEEPDMSSITTDDQLQHMENIRVKAREAHEISRNLINQRIKHKIPELKAGDKVWLNTRHLQLKDLPRKLSPKRTGPFEVLKRTGPVNYKLKLPGHWRIHPNFHVQLLWPANENTQYRKFTEKPPSDIIEGEREWEVEDVVGHRRKDGREEYLVHWKGYPVEERTWEPKNNL